MRSIKDMKELAGKKRRDILYSFADHLAYYPAKLLLKTKITPNQVTIFWILGQVVSALFLASGERITMIISLIMFQTFFILDCTDGIMARFRKDFSLRGEYLDYLGHYVANPVLLGALTIGVYKIHGEAFYLIAGVVAIFSFLLNKALTLNPFWYSFESQRELIEKTRRESLLLNQKNFLYSIFAFMRLEYLFNFMFWGILFGYANYTLLIYSLFFVLELFRKLIMQYVMLSRVDKSKS